MELLQIALALIAAVLASAVLEPFLPRVSMPLVQMLVGIVMYFFVKMPGDLNIDTDLFLVMFIAPLLFDESRNVNNRALFDNIHTILSLAIGLVLVLVLVIGFVLHWLVPSVPLAAAFALGAALGPTDAVAVASLGKDIKLNSRQKALLSGEALLNDASGVVSFQFAIAAAVTGAFSLAEAGRVFLFDFAGGIAVGLVVAVVAAFIVRQIRRIGVESVTFHVCFEVFLPFFTYLVAEGAGVSGILAVVSCGLLVAWLPESLRLRGRGRDASTFSSRLSMASESVWNLMSFVLNGVIFTTLGFIMPSTVAPALEQNAHDIVWLLALVLIVSLVAEGVRYLWVLACDYLSDHKTTGGRFRFSGKLARDALVTTLAGPKGAVSLSIALTIPTTVASGAAFPQRNLLLFIICGVIIVTLLLANFVVPVLAPKPDEDESALDPQVEVDICRNVIRGLRDQKTPENRRAVALVSRAYSERIAAARRSSVPARQLRYLRQEVLLEQESCIRQMMAADEVDSRLAERYLKRFERARRVLTRRHRGPKRQTGSRPLADNTSAMRRIQRRIGERGNEKRVALEMKVRVEEASVDYLERVAREMDQVRVDAALALLAEHKPFLRALKAQLRRLDRAEGLVGESVPDDPGDAHIGRSDTGSLHREAGSPGADDDEPEGLADVQAEALRLELDQIQEKHELGLISAADARELREEIYLVQMGLSDS